MKIFSDFDVYERKYTYDEMKVMNVLSTISESKGLDYEDLCCIAEAIYAHWVDGRTKDEDEKYTTYPWLAFKSTAEDGYIQAYAYRVSTKFIKLYKETTK